MSFDADLEFELEVERLVMNIVSRCLTGVYRTMNVESRLVEDLCIDSIDLVEVVMALNDTFDIDIPEGVVEAWRTVSDICHWVYRLKKGG